MRGQACKEHPSESTMRTGAHLCSPAQARGLNWKSAESRGRHMQTEASRDRQPLTEPDRGKHRRAEAER
eukprot:15442882-Alexandrium_andersonii.AAC.1